jgi:hypothetical protein
MEWTVANVFYLFGSIFFVLLILTLIGAVIGTLMLVNKAKEMEEDLRLQVLKLRSEAAEQSKETLKTAYPLLLSAGINLGYHFLRKKFSRA